MAYEDLLKDSSQSYEDGNYFLITITELDLATTYPLQFRWKYKDGSYGKNWSSTYYVTTPGSTVPNEPNLSSGDVVGGAGFITVTWNGKDASNNNLENIDRVEVYISGTSFPDGTKPAGSFKTAGTQTFTASAGIYIVQLKAIRVDGATSFFSSARTVTVTAIEEAIEAPVVPTGFTARAILGGIEISWAGTYTGGATWSGFQAINIYAGTASSATGGTYIKVGQMTANKVSNKIVIPIDGTYVRYGFPAYIHASSVNKATPPVESSISANVASATPSQVVNTDLINEVITATKIATAAITEVKIDTAAITEAKIASSAITETKIATDAVTSPKIVAGAIVAGKIAAGAVTTEKLDSLAITADKIAANAITASKILAGEVTTDKLNALAVTSEKIAALAITAGKIDTNAITADLINTGTLKATTYIRVGTTGGARVDIAAVSSGITSGLNIYDSGGSPIFEAPLGGGVTVTGHLKATQISTTSGDFTVSTSGILTAKSADINGTIKATSGYIGGTTSGIYIANGAIQNDSGGSQFKLDSSGKARFGSSTGNAIVINPTAGNGGYYLYHTSGGDSGSASSVFNVSTSGVLTATGGNFSGTITNGTDYWNAAGSFRIGGSSGIDYDKTSGIIKIGGSNGIVYNGSNQVTIGASGNTVTINTSTGNVSIGGTLTASAISLSNGDFWNSNGDFQVGGSKGITYASNAVSIGNWRIGINSATSTYGVIFGQDLDVFLYGKSTDSYALITNSRPISIGTGMSSTTLGILTGGYIQATGKVVGGGTTGNRSEFAYLNVTGFMSISSGYGVDTNWSPSTDNSKDLGLATSNPGNDSSNIRWRRLYANNTTVTTSDIRLKTEINNSQLGLNFVNQLRPVSYKWIEGSKDFVKDENGNLIELGIDSNGKPIYEMISIPGVRKHYGFIAQEVKEVMDNLEIDDFAGWVKDDLSNPNSYQSLSYEQFIPPLTKAIQELSNKLDLIESRLDALEG